MGRVGHAARAVTSEKVDEDVKMKKTAGTGTWGRRDFGPLRFTRGIPPTQAPSSQWVCVSPRGARHVL